MIEFHPIILSTKNPNPVSRVLSHPKQARGPLSSEKTPVDGCTASSRTQVGGIHAKTAGSSSCCQSPPGCVLPSPITVLHMLLPLNLGPAIPTASSLSHLTGASYSAKPSLTGSRPTSLCPSLLHCAHQWGSTWEQICPPPPGGRTFGRVCKCCWPLAGRDRGWS